MARAADIHGALKNPARRSAQSPELPVGEHTEALLSPYIPTVEDPFTG